MRSSGPHHYLVTGGAGFIGSALIPRLLIRGDWVTVIDRLLYGAEGCLAHIDHPRFDLLAMDICDPPTNQAALARNTGSSAPKIEAVIHLAAAVGHGVCQTMGEEEAFRINVHGAGRIYRLAQELGANKFIFSSTCSVYGRTRSKALDEDGDLQPVSMYGHSKVKAEEALLELAEDSACELLIFRLASVFGLSPRMRFDVLVNQLVRQAHLEHRLVVFHPGHWRPFVHIQDAVDAFLLGLEAPVRHDRPLILNLGSQMNCVTKQALADVIEGVMTGVRVEQSNQALSPPDQDVRLAFSRIETELGFQAARPIHQGVEELMTALQQGWFVNQPQRYCNRMTA